MREKISVALNGIIHPVEQAFRVGTMVFVIRVFMVSLHFDSSIHESQGVCNLMDHTSLLDKREHILIF